MENQDLICLECGALMGDSAVCPKCGAAPTIETYGYSIKPAAKGGGFLLYKNEDPVSMVRESMKWMDEVSRKHDLPINLIESALLSAKNGSPTNDEASDEPNPGAVIVVLAQTNSEAIFKDQLDETYVTFREKMGIMGVMGMTAPIVLPSTPNYIPKNIVPTEQSNNRVHDSHDSQTPKNDVLRTVRIKSFLGVWESWES